MKYTADPRAITFLEGLVNPRLGDHTVLSTKDGSEFHVEFVAPTAVFPDLDVAVHTEDHLERKCMLYVEDA